MTFIFDTGSSWLWVNTDKCPTTECSGERYHYSKSSEYAETTTEEKIVYGKGQVDGMIASDTVSLFSNGASSATSKFLQTRMKLCDQRIQNF